MSEVSYLIVELEGFLGVPDAPQGSQEVGEDKGIRFDSVLFKHFHLHKL